MSHNRRPVLWIAGLAAILSALTPVRAAVENAAAILYTVYVGYEPRGMGTVTNGRRLSPGVYQMRSRAGQVSRTHPVVVVD